jgi:acyl-CoA reductase-like NAD-dependent aldehyde dehydrogenase
MFNHASFDYLDKLGYHIWDDVDYEAENVEAQYEALLKEYKVKWAALTPDEKAQKLMEAGRLTEDQLAQHCIDNNWEYFQ